MSNISNQYNMQSAMAGMQEQNASTQQRQINSLSNTNSDPAKEKKLREACEGFESIFIQKMWEQMRASLPKDGLLSSSKEEQFWQGMYDQELAKSMASSGGIGLADMMMEQMNPKQTPNSSARSHGLEISPAPLREDKFGVEAETITQRNQQAPLEVANQNTLSMPTSQNAPIMNMNIYDEAAVDHTQSQDIDNAQAQVATAPAEPIVTRVTYQTNLPRNKRAADDLIADLLAEQQAKAMQEAKAQEATASANNNNDRVISTSFENQAIHNAQRVADPFLEPLQESFEEMEPVLAAPQAQQAQAFDFSKLQSNNQAQVNTEPQDILAGISQTYVKTNQENILQHRDISQIAQQLELKPTYAGGPDMPKPQAIHATTELGYLSPEKGSFESPVDGKITSGFGWRLDPINGKRSWHNGVDITAAENSPVRAAQAGTVSFAGRDEEFGNLVIIQHPNGLSTLYGHNSEISVEVGDYIPTGTEIARVGSSGRALGHHVHFEIRKADMPINPENVLIQDITTTL